MRPRCSNLGLPAVKLPTLHIRGQFQNEKALIANEMGARSGPSLANYVHMPRGGVCNVRRHLEAAKWSSPNEMGGHASLVRMRNGTGANYGATENVSIRIE